MHENGLNKKQSKNKEYRPVVILWSMTALSALILLIVALFTAGTGVSGGEAEIQGALFRFSMATSPLSVYFAMLLAGVMLAVSMHHIVCAACGDLQVKMPAQYSLWMFSFFISMSCLLFSDNLYGFLFFWELMSLISYRLVVWEKEKEESVRASRFYFVMTQLGTLCLMTAFILYEKETGTTSLAQLTRVHQLGSQGSLIFALMVLGFGTKAGLFPVNLWLPSAHPAAPSSMSALMSGVMVKMPIYAMLRIALPLMFDLPETMTDILFALAVVTVFAGALLALVETNIKRILAWSTVENIGLLFTGIAMLAWAARMQSQLIAGVAMTAVLFHSLIHALFKSSLFLSAGEIVHSMKTRYIERMGGLSGKMPLAAVSVLIAVMTAATLPPLGGFAGEWMTLQALFHTLTDKNGPMAWRVIGALGAAAVVLGAAAALWAYTRFYGFIFLGKPRSQQAEEAEYHQGNWIVPACMSGVLVMVGIMSGLIIRTISQKVVPEIIGGTQYTQNTAGDLISVMEDGHGYSPWMFAAMLAVALGIGLMIRLVAGPVKTVKKRLWDCGYPNMTGRMQYSAGGWSKPALILFRFLLRPERKLQQLRPDNPHFFRTARYDTRWQNPLDRWIYQPVIRGIESVARQTRYRIQTGSIHAYLVYIFAVVMALLVYSVLM